MSASIRMTADRVAAVQASIRSLMGKEVLVGIPAEAPERRTVEGEDAPPNNATIGYDMEYGVPSKNVPARPWLVPGIISVQDKVANQMVAAIRAIVQPRENQVDADGRLHAAGLVAANGIKRYINAGIGPALSEYTLMKRAARGPGSSVGKAAQRELNRRDEGYAPGLDLAKPLVDTGQFRNSITYVIKTR